MITIFKTVLLDIKNTQVGFPAVGVLTTRVERDRDDEKSFLSSEKTGTM